VKAVYTVEGRRLELRDAPERELRTGDVRLRIAACGICGSDLHALRGAAFTPGHTPGQVMGHEYAGTVEEVGPEVNGWSVGDPVAVFPTDPCDRCDACRAGHPNLCPHLGGSTADPGGFAERCIVRQRQLTRLPAGFPLEHATLAEPLAVGVHGVARADATPETPVAVLGGGPIGVVTAFALRARRCERLVVFEPREFRRRYLEQLGFAALEPGGDSRAAAAAVLGAAPAVVIDCTGHRSGLKLAVELLPVRGRIVLLGVPPDLGELTGAAVTFGELEVRGAKTYTRAEFDDSVRLLVEGIVPAERLVTAVYPLADAQRAFAELLDPDGEQLKVLLRP